PAGATSATITMTPIDDWVAESTETVVVTLTPGGTGYTVGTPSQATANIIDNDWIPNGHPFNMPPEEECGCGCGGDTVKTQAGAGGNNSGGFSTHPVRYSDGTVKLDTCELGSEGFGVRWGHTRSWSNGPGYASTGYNGNGWVVDNLPYLRQADANVHIEMISNGVTARYFDQVGAIYYPRFFLKDQFTAGASEFTLADSTGARIKFFDFSVT